MIDYVISENGVVQNQHFEWDPAEVDCCNKLPAYTCVDPCSDSEIKPQIGDELDNQSHGHTRRLIINWRLGFLALIPSLQFFYSVCRLKRNKKERDYDIVQVDNVCCWQNKRSEGCWK